MMLTILALLIASIGLIGLTSFYAEQKNREICLRKVHGASLRNINSLMFAEFLSLIVLANLIAWPLTYFIAREWLHSYSQQTSIHWSIFVLAGGITLTMLSIIVVIRTLKSYTANPAEVLKHQG